MNDFFNKRISILINKFNAKKFNEVINDSLVLLKKKENDFLWNLLGLSYQNVNQLKKSINCFENSIHINSKNISAYNNLGISHKNLKNYQIAEHNFLKAIDLNDNYLNALVNLGNLKNDTYYFDDAIFFYEKALKIDPNNVLLNLNLANVFQTINEIDKAKFYLNKILNIDPLFTNADFRLSKLEKYELDSDHLDKMLKKLNDQKLDSNQKIYLYFAIAKAYEDIKQFDDCTEYLKKGNNLQRSILNYNPNFYKNLPNKIINLFNQIDYKKFSKSNEGKNNIFILGMPRSGTSLIEKIISSHSKVESLSETNFISDMIFKNLFTNFEKDIDEVNVFLENNLSQEYNKFLKLFNVKSKIIIDKTLSNFWCIGFIKIFFPDAKIIHSFRSPKDNVLSIYKNLFDTHEGWLYDETELKEYYSAYKEIMTYWNNIFGNEILNFQYEDLIKNPETQIKSLINFCDLNWEENCLNFYKNNNPIKTLSVNQANQRIYKTSVNKSELFEREIPTLFKGLI